LLKRAATDNHIPMKSAYGLRVLWVSILLLCGRASTVTAMDETSRLAELDQFWSEVRTAVQDGNYERYEGTCHPSGVLVSGTKGTSYPLSKALARWKPGFLDTSSGKMKAGVEFRFSQRFGDETTAHETGIFHYWTVDSNGARKDDYIHFESLLLKETRWRTLMEYQKSVATESEWEKLKH
jgi:hypothetical protein